MATSVKVKINALDPEWGYGACGHPIVGTKGTISNKHKAPEGKVAVLFRYGFKAVRMNGDSDHYQGSFTLYITEKFLDYLE